MQPIIIEEIFYLLFIQYKEHYYENLCSNYPYFNFTCAGLCN